MTDEAQAVADPQVDETNLTEAEVDPAAGTADVAGEVEVSTPDEGATAEQPRFSLSDIPDEELLSHLRERRDASGLSVEDRIRKSERDKTFAQLKREQGANERVQQYHQWLAEQVANGASAEEIARETPTFVKANEDFARVEVAKAFANKALDGFGLDDETRSAYAEQIEALTTEPERLYAIAEQLWEQGASRFTENRVNERIGNLTLDEIPKDSRLHASLQAHIESEVTKELEARAAEKEPVANPPRTPKGTPGVDASSRYLAMSPQEQARLTPEEWAEFRSLVGAR